MNMRNSRVEGTIVSDDNGRRLWKVKDGLVEKTRMRHEDVKKLGMSERKLGCFQEQDKTKSESNSSRTTEGFAIHSTKRRAWVNHPADPIAAG